MKISPVMLKIARSQKPSVQSLEREVGDDGYGDEEEEFASPSGFRGREEEKNYDKDPEFAEILGSCLDDPQKARSKVSNPAAFFIEILQFQLKSSLFFLEAFQCALFKSRFYIINWLMEVIVCSDGG